MKEYKYGLWLSPWERKLEEVEDAFKENKLEFIKEIPNDIGFDMCPVGIEGIVYYFNSNEDKNLAIEISDNF